MSETTTDKTDKPVTEVTVSKDAEVKVESAPTIELPKDESELAIEEAKPPAEAKDKIDGNPVEDEVKTSEVKNEDAAETEKAGEKAEGDDKSENKLLKELDDEAPKTFPQVLMEILSNDEDADTIAWLPHGRSFIIYKKKKFASHVLPKYFKATKFTSFTRKLNRWGFTRVTRGPEMGSYYHKLFLREDPSLCLRMSSHSSSKFHEQQQLMPTPMAPGGMHFGGMPFMGGMGMPGMNPMMNGPMAPGMNPADLSQQNQMINQQLQQLQWQQFQLQQLQQQQHQQQQHQQQMRNAELLSSQGASAPASQNRS